MKKKNIKDSIKDGLIISAKTTEIILVLNVGNMMTPKASRDDMDIINVSGGIFRVVLVKDCVYKKWINESLVPLWL